MSDGLCPACLKPFQPVTENAEPRAEVDLAAEDTADAERRATAPAEAIRAGTSVIVFGIMLSLHTAWVTWFTKDYGNLLLLIAVVLVLHFGAKARKGDRRASKWCLGLGVYFLVSSLLGLGLMLWMTATSETIGMPLSLRVYTLVAPFGMYAWSAVNITLLRQALAAIRRANEVRKRGAVDECWKLATRT